MVEEGENEKDIKNQEFKTKIIGLTLSRSDDRYCSEAISRTPGGISVARESTTNPG